jgi:lysophospholipase L1-like esterase
VDVHGGATGGSIIVLGDSISVVEPDLDQNDRWTDDLSQRLQASPGGSDLAVVNAGISGNRVLADGTGPSAISRFANDVVSAPGARYVVVEEGVNDIGAGSSAQDIENGYEQLVTIAHAAGLRILGTTLTPIGGSFYDTPENEAVRDAVNNWIRTSGAFDAVVDLDAAVHDPQNPRWWLPAYDNGSHLHPSGAGAAAMANAVDLQLFAPSAGGDVPTLTEPSSETVAAGATQSVRGSYSDTFAAGNPGLLYLSVSDSSGTLSATDVSGNLATGSGTSNIAVSAPYSAVNAILASLTYTAGSQGGSDGIAFDIWNQAGVETTAAVPVTVTTTGGGGGPALNVPSSETVLPGSILTVSGSYSDSFAQGNPGSLFLGISDSGGTLSATDASGNLVVGSGTNRIALSTDYVDLNVILANLHYTAGASSGSDTISFDVWNQAGVETAGATSVTIDPSSFGAAMSQAPTTMAADFAAPGPLGSEAATLNTTILSAGRTMLHDGMNQPPGLPLVTT